MHTILIENYACDFCNKIFDKKWECENHEMSEHKCPNCEYSYYVYGCELNCSRINEHKKCKFKEIKVKDKK